MKATGIIRRLDDLGRLVIPKEIRKQYQLKEGDSIEFFIENEKIVLQKYDVLSSKQQELIQMCEALKVFYKVPIYFIYEDIINESVIIDSLFLKRCHVYHSTLFQNERIIEEGKEESGWIIPVILDGYWQGSFVLIQDPKKDVSAVEAFASFLTFKYQS